MVERALKAYTLQQEVPLSGTNGAQEILRSWERVKGHSKFLKQIPLCLIWDEQDVNRVLEELEDNGHDVSGFHDQYNEEEKREFINDFFMRKEDRFMTTINQDLYDAVLSEVQDINDQESEEE